MFSKINNEFCHNILYSNLMAVFDRLIMQQSQQFKCKNVQFSFKKRLISYNFACIIIVYRKKMDAIQLQLIQKTVFLFPELSQIAV